MSFNKRKLTSTLIFLKIEKEVTPLNTKRKKRK